MTFEFLASDTLPAFAWCAHIVHRRDVVTVVHGSGVETSPPNAFVEGAWNGPFSALDFLCATVLAGTGGRAGSDAVRFCGGTDRCSPTFSVKTPAGLVISNSPVLAMNAAGEQPDPFRPWYPYDLIALWRQGLHCLNGRLRLRSGNALRMHAGAIVTIDRDTRVVLTTHSPGAEPGDFASFQRAFEDALRTLFENGVAPGRRHSFVPMASLSAGYDSTAVSVMARNAGCREAYTYVDSRRDSPNDDSGAEIARTLGMECHEYNRWAFLDMDGIAETEMALFSLSTSAPLAAVEPRLKGRIVLNGFFGDSLWSAARAGLITELALPWMRYASPLSVLEFRLRAGFLTLAGPTILGRHTSALHRIMTAPGMERWSIGERYDRPLPRRIGEEAGLTREQFGRRKIGTAHVHPGESRDISAAAFAGYSIFRDDLTRRMPWTTYAQNRSQVELRHLLWDAIGFKHGRRVRSTPMQRRFPFVLNTPPIRIEWPSMFAFQWVCEVLKARYTLPTVTFP